MRALDRLYLLSLLCSSIALCGCVDDLSSARQGCTSDEQCRQGRVCSEDGRCLTEMGANESTEEAPEPGPFAPFVRGESAEDPYVTGYNIFPEESGHAFRVQLFLESSGRATLFYEEGFPGHGFNPYADSPFHDRPGHRTKIEASWSVEGDELVVGDILRCGLAESETREGLSCSLRRDLGSPGASEQTLRMWREEGASPQDSVYGDYDSLE